MKGDKLCGMQLATYVQHKCRTEAGEFSARTS